MSSKVPGNTLVLVYWMGNEKNHFLFARFHRHYDGPYGPLYFPAALLRFEKKWNFVRQNCDIPILTAHFLNQNHRVLVLIVLIIYLSFSE